MTAEAIRVVAEDVASGEATSWSAHTLEGAFERQRQLDSEQAAEAAEEAIIDDES